MRSGSDKFNRTAKFELAVIVVLVIFIAVILTVILRKRESVPAMLESVPETLTDPEDMDTHGKIFLEEGGYGEIWLPVLDNVPACSHDLDKLVSRNGRFYYMEESGITSALGIDVSEFQKEIDWEAVRDSGIAFAIIRAGFRGYESGKIVADERFTQNIEGALAAGLDVGVYFYSQAITPEEAREEARFTLDMIDGYDLTYPVVFDWEFVTEGAARTDRISVDDLTACTIAFCEEVKAAGQRPMIYQNKRTSLLKLDLQQLTEYDFWLAEYNDRATYYYDYDMWQYCSDGIVPGISGRTDMNICFTDYKGVQE